MIRWNAHARPIACCGSTLRGISGNLSRSPGEISQRVALTFRETPDRLDRSSANCSILLREMLVGTSAVFSKSRYRALQIFISKNESNHVAKKRNERLQEVQRLLSERL
jgi:hypothetical protein